MTDKKEKELIEGCPWRHFDVYGEPVCKAVANPGRGILEYPCTGPDCGPMYFARGELIKISASEKFMRDLLMKIQFENSEKMGEFLLFSPNKKTGEGDMPTTKPDGTTDAATPSNEYIFLKETANDKDHPAES